MIWGAGGHALNVGNWIGGRNGLGVGWGEVEGEGKMSLEGG